MKTFCLASIVAFVAMAFFAIGLAIVLILGYIFDCYEYNRRHDEKK